MLFADLLHSPTLRTPLTSIAGPGSSRVASKIWTFPSRQGSQTFPTGTHFVFPAVYALWYTVLDVDWTYTPSHRQQRSSGPSDPVRLASFCMRYQAWFVPIKGSWLVGEPMTHNKDIGTRP